MRLLYIISLNSFLNIDCTIRKKEKGYLIESTTKNHIQYIKGDIPLILTAPHGGGKTPDAIQDRKTGVFDMDDYTLELTLNIIEEFQKCTGKTPYGVIADISRTKVDLNRKETEAYEDKKAKAVYDEFHSCILEAEQQIDKEFGKGLYIDIHGQSHPKGYLEFGYLLYNDILSLHESSLKEYQDKSSIRTLGKFSPESFINQLRGPHSMGSLMCNLGYDSIPSIKLPYATDDNYFEGAYDTIRYGSLKGGNISGIQIEFPYKNIRDTYKNRKKCAKAFVESLVKFMDIHLQIKI